LNSPFAAVVNHSVVILKNEIEITITLSEAKKLRDQLDDAIDIIQLKKEKEA